MAVEKERFAGTDKKFFVVSELGGINTESPREAIKNNEFSWIENLQPIAAGNFRAMYAEDAPIYTSGGNTIVYHYPFNIGGTNYIFVVLSDGTAVAVNIATRTATSITSTAGAFYGTGVATLPQAVQSGQQYLVIVSKGSVGYAVWDGTNLFQPGGLSPIVTITNGGAGYTNAPTVQFLGGSGTGATAVATVNQGVVTGVNITNPGSGYILNDVPTVDLVGGQTSGSGAALTAVLSSLASGSGASITASWILNSQGPEFDQLVGITVSSGGSGYSSFTTASWTPLSPGYWSTPSTFPYHIVPGINLQISGGVIVGATLSTPAPITFWVTQGTTPRDPTITITDNGGGFFVSSVTITSGGTNYSPSTVITATGGGSPVYQASISPVIAAGVITGVHIANAGKYGSNTPPTLTVTDTNTQATATVSLMPFGNAGTCVEIYQNRVWIGNGATVLFSASTNIFDFTTANGSGAFASQDSFLKQQFTNLKQFGSFLYLFADSSINVISNVNQSGTPVITTFNNQNLDPQIGTPWFNCVVAQETQMVFANTIGVYTVQGNSVQKVSDELDGIFAAAKVSLLGVTATTMPSAAAMTINQKPVYMLVLPVHGPLDAANPGAPFLTHVVNHHTILNFTAGVGGPRTALVMWDGKNWWVGSQLSVYSQVATQEINSVLQAWGNSTTSINKLFTTPSGSLQKLWQPKLFSGEGAHLVKQAMRLYTMAIDNSSGGYTFSGTFDYRLENTLVLSQPFSVTDTSLTGSGSINANVRGNYLSFTLHTFKDDFTLLGQAILYQEQSPMP